MLDYSLFGDEHVKKHPDFDAYQASSSRDIPVVLLRPRR